MSPPLQPPGQVSEVTAKGVLVLAPHYDDEVLGCGGLLVRLLEHGARVRVLFLTDGGGGEGDESGDRETYRGRRRQEADAALAVLGISEATHLGLADGRLTQERDALCDALRQAILRQPPDLLLAPSPLETSADHRASFAALGDVLASLRPDDELYAAASGMTILLYEVNHPAYPDVLVDVGEHLEKLEQAMGCYRSQQERHDYGAAALGLRRYRTLSLDPEVRAAEGFRRLELEDFTTRSAAQLILHLGGVPRLLKVDRGPRVSVIVRTKDRPELLVEALASLAESSYRRLEVVVVNDGGTPPELAAEYPFSLIRVDLPRNQGRARAADAGVAASTGEFVAFLDDDDLVAPEHFDVLVAALAGAEVRVVYSDAAVGVYAPDAAGGWRCRERRLPYSRDFDLDILLVDNYIPFNTLLMDRRLLAQVGAFDRDLSFFEDWDFLIRLGSLVPFHHLRRVTCEYRHFETADHHVLAGSAGRQRADFMTMKARVLAKHTTSLSPERLARAIDTLRSESVDLVEENALLGRRLTRIEKARTTVEENAAHLVREVARLHREKAGVEQELVAVRKDVLIAQQETLVVRQETLGVRRSLEEQHQRYAELDGVYRGLQERYHSLNGELDASREAGRQLLAAHQDARRELRRLYDEEKTLRTVVADQTSHLERTYAEIERLNGVVRGMEQTRAWRFSQWWQRKLS